MKQRRDGPLYLETAIADFLETFKTWLPLESLDNAEWIRRQWVAMVLKKCASQIREARKKERQGNKRLAMDLRECAWKQAKRYVPEFPNTTCMIVIRRVPNGNNDQTSSNQLQALYTDLKHWEELIDFIEKNCPPNEPYYLIGIYKCNLTQKELDEECMGLYTPRQMMNNPLYGQISYNSSLSNAFKLKLRHDVKLFVVQMKAATRKNIAKHVMGPANVIPTNLVTVCSAHYYSVYLEFRGIR